MYFEYLLPAFSGIIAAYFGYRFGKWSRFKEQIFAKKIELYNNFAIEFFELMKVCSPRTNVTIKHQTDAVDAYTKLLARFYEASLFMPRKLHEDINIKLKPTQEHLAKVAKFWQIILSLKKNKKIDIPFEQFKEEIIVSEKLMVELPGPFEKVIIAFPEILEMLKKDLGVFKFDSKFYKS